MGSLSSSTQINPDRMRAGLSADMLATDLAEYLVRKGERCSTSEVCESLSGRGNDTKRHAVLAAVTWRSTLCARVTCGGSLQPGAEAVRGVLAGDLAGYLMRKGGRPTWRADLGMDRPLWPGRRGCCGGC